VKNDQIVEKIDKIYKPQNWERKRKRNTGTEVCICVHSKESMGKYDVKLMLFYCKTLLPAYSKLSLN
jgi:hypothetical protein